MKPMAGNVQSEKGRVLYVEDNADVRVTMEAHLEMAFEVVSCTNAQEAIKILRSAPFDVVVTDHNMPGESGADLLHRVETEFSSTVGILVTGDAVSTRVKLAVNAAMETGRTLVLYKPVEPKVLIDWVKNGVAMARLARARADARKPPRT
jgi:DNA-binding NtrC family response regulator